MNSRMLAVGTAAVLIGAVIGATPANAQGAGDADLAVELTGTTIAEGAPGKFGTVTITNDGPDTATGVVITYDATSLDTSKVQLPLEDCPPDGGIAVCDVIDPEQITPGDHVTFFDFLEVVPGASGDAGVITVSVEHDGTDPDESNNSFDAIVEINGSGPDLLVFAPDVHNEAEVDVENDIFEVLDTPVVPGSDAIVEVFVENQGDQAVSGIEISITLPEHVTFTLPEAECTHAAGDSETTCTYTSLTLLPASETDPDEACDWTGSCGWAIFPASVAEDAPSPEALTGGVVEAFGLEALPELTLQAVPENPELPENFTTAERPEVDPTDNVSEFTVFVSEPDDGGTGGGGPLPVTGAPAALIGGVGAAVLAVGLALFLLGRTRRVVLQAPSEDSTSTE